MPPQHTTSLSGTSRTGQLPQNWEILSLARRSLTLSHLIFCRVFLRAFSESKKLDCTQHISVFTLPKTKKSCKKPMW